jgi:2-phosphosulfolactate phosphatase
MRVDMSFTADELEFHDRRNKIGVAIDVLRATSTVIIAFKNGCSSFTVILGIERAREAAKNHKEGEVLLGGALRGLKPKGFDLGNAPDEYSGEIIKGKHIIFASSNGVRAMHSMQDTGKVLLAAFLNISAVCNEINASNADVLIGCSGDFGQFSLADTVCAGMIIHRLTEIRSGKLQKSDSATVAEILYDIYKDDIRGMLFRSEWGQGLVQIGREKDIDTCAQIDVCSVVPKFRDGTIFL